MPRLIQGHNTRFWEGSQVVPTDFDDRDNGPGEADNSKPVTCHNPTFRGKSTGRSKLNKRSGRNVRLTECPNPWPYEIGKNPDGSPLTVLVGCRRQTCPYCGPAKAWGTVCRIREALTEPDMAERDKWFLTADLRDDIITKFLPRAVTQTERSHRAQVFNAIGTALRYAVKDLVAGSKGANYKDRLGTWIPAFDVKRVGAKHISEAGHLHIHGVLFAQRKHTPVRPASSPFTQEQWDVLQSVSCDAVQGFLLEKYNQHLARILGVPGQSHTGKKQIGGIHLEPCRDVEASVCYVVMDGGKPWEGGWQFVPRTHRVTKTPGLIESQRKSEKNLLRNRARE